MFTLFGFANIEGIKIIVSSKREEILLTLVKKFKF